MEIIMKNKSIIIAIIIMLAAIGAGLALEHINNISAYERLEKMISFDIPLESIRIDVNGSMQFDFPESIKELTPMFSKKVKVDGYTEVICDPNNYQMLTYEFIDMSGMTFEVSSFLNHDEIFIKYPVIEKPLYISLNDIEQVSGFDIPNHWLSKLYTISLNMNTNFAKSFINNINPEHVSYGDNIQLKQNGYTQTLKSIVIDLDDKDIINIAKAIAASTINNSELNDFIYEIIDYIAKENNASNDEIKEIKTALTDFKNKANKFINEGHKSEEFKEFLDSPEFSKFYNAFQNFFDESTIQITLGVNNMNIPLYLKSDIDMTFTDKNSDMEFGIKYNIEQQLSKINEIKEIDRHDFNKDHCLPLINFIKDSLPNGNN